MCAGVFAYLIVGKHVHFAAHQTSTEWKILVFLSHQLKESWEIIPQNSGSPGKKSLLLFSSTSVGQQESIFSLGFWPQEGASAPLFRKCLHNSASSYLGQLTSFILCSFCQTWFLSHFLSYLHFTLFVRVCACLNYRKRGNGRSECEILNPWIMTDSCVLLDVHVPERHEDQTGRNSSLSFMYLSCCVCTSHTHTRTHISPFPALMLITGIDKALP